MTLKLGTALLLVVALGAPGASAEARDPGPRLTVPARALKAALKCPQAVGSREPVLLVHGTTSNPTVAWSVGLQPLLSERGHVVCTVTLPEVATGRIDVAGEYVVSSIRRMAARFDRPVNVIGHSQGGMLPRWAIKWWPDVRSLVGDVIGLASSNHGTPVAAALCTRACSAAGWQQSPRSRFLAALNAADETPGRLSYSVVSSQTDTTVPPPSPELRGEADDSNTAIQAICPGREVSHTQVLYDAVSVALVVDALTHVGPARASRLSAGVCERKLADGIDPAAVEEQEAAAGALTGTSLAAAERLGAEPQVPRYATQPAPAPRAQLRIRVRRGDRIEFRALGIAGRDRWPLPRALITAGGRRAITDSQGRATLRLARGRTSVRVRLVAAGLMPLSRRLR